MPHGRFVCSALVAASLCSLARLPSAHAADADTSPPSATHAPEHAERRSGFSFGLAGGILTSSASGYPNDVAKIGSPEYAAHLGLGVSMGGSFWIGGALADWLNVGVGATGGGIRHGGLRGSGGVFSARIEAFPLFYRGGPYRDLGVLFTAGTGSYRITRGPEKLAAGAGTSAVGIGAFYEPWRLWLLSFGPQIEYSHQFSDSISAHTLIIGMRSVFYGGP